MTPFRKTRSIPALGSSVLSRNDGLFSEIKISAAGHLLRRLAQPSVKLARQISQAAGQRPRGRLLRELAGNELLNLRNRFPPAQGVQMIRHMLSLRRHAQDQR
jgi:hypothetical protein